MDSKLKFNKQVSTYIRTWKIEHCTLHEQWLNIKEHLHIERKHTKST